jgi:hypothetical protein
VAKLDGEPRTLQFFAMRSMASGDAFHRAYPAPAPRAKPSTLSLRSMPGKQTTGSIRRLFRSCISGPRSSMANCNSALNCRQFESSPYQDVFTEHIGATETASVYIMR